MFGQVARNDDFFDQAPGKQEKGPVEVRAGDAFLFELGQEIAGPQDRARQDGRKKGDEAQHLD